MIERFLKSRPLAAILGSLLIGTVAASAQQAATSPAPHPAAATYRISGKVVDARTGTPVPRASVRVAETKERSESRAVTASDDGSFAFDGLPKGKYSLSAASHGYLEQSYEEHDQYSTAIAVGRGLASEGLVFKLAAEGIISGTVTDEAGEPVRSAQIRLFQDEDTDGIRATRQRETVTTDDRGVYEFADLAPGAYYLVVTAHPWYAQRIRQFSVDDAGTQQADQDAAAAQSRALDVAYPTTYYPGTTDEDAATPIPIKGGDRLEADISLAAQPAIRLKVKLPDGEPGRRGGTTVALTRTIFGQAEPMPMQEYGRSGSEMELEGVLPGHYDVAVSQFVPGQGEGATKHFSTDIASGTTELAEDTAIDAVPVAGKVVSMEGKLPAMSGISLLASNSRRGQYAALNDAGEFNLEVAPGTYEVLGNINGMHFISLKASGAQLAGRMLTVKTGDAPKLQIVAGTGHGEIEGTALLAGKPVGGVMVLLAPEDPKNNQVLFRRDQSDSDGTFDLGNIFPGRYRLLAIQDGWDLEWANPAVLQAFLAKSVPIEVKSGDHLSQTIDVQTR
jgi:hypothetical protein